MIPSISELRTLATRYQARLKNLHDWEIKVKFGSGKELACRDGSRLHGRVDWDAINKTAVITLHRGRLAIPTLRHEFIHICLEGHNEDELPYDHSYELAVDVLAELLA